MKKTIAFVVFILIIVFLSYPRVLPIIVEYNLKESGLLTSKTQVEREPYQVILKDVTLYIPLNQQELAVVEIPKFIVTYSLSSMLRNKLEQIIIPVANVKVPFYFVQQQTGKINDQIDYQGLDVIRPEKLLWVKQINIEVKDVRHNINGLITGEMKVIGLTNKDNAIIQSEWQIKPLQYKKLFVINSAKIKANGKFIPKKRVTELDITGNVDSAKVRRFAINNFNFFTKMDLSDDKEKITAHFVLDKLYIDVAKWHKNPMFVHGDIEYHQGLYGKVHFVDHARYFNGVMLFKDNQYQLAIKSVNFRDNQVLFDKVVPGLNTDSMLVNGQLNINGEGNFKQYPKTNITVSGDNFQIEGQRLHVDNFNLDFHINQFYPLQITDGILNADRLNYYLPLTKVHFDFGVSQNKDKTSLDINQFKTGFAGGQVNLQNQHYVFNDYENDVKVNLQQVQLGQLANIINIDGLTGDCKMGGSINFVLLPTTVKIRNGNLQKQSQNCMINYKPKKTPTSLASNENVAQVMQYLSDLVVNELNVDLNTGDKGTKLTATIMGKNPKMFEGIPIKLNLTVNGPLQAILTSIFIGSDTVRNVVGIENKP